MTNIIPQIEHRHGDVTKLPVYLFSSQRQMLLLSLGNKPLGNGLVLCHDFRIPSEYSRMFRNWIESQETNRRKIQRQKLHKIGNASFRTQIENEVLTDERQQNGQEDETVGGANQDDTQVHAEVKDLENLRFGKCQDDYSSEFGQRDARQNLSYK